MTRRSTRRDFLKTSAASAAAAFWISDSPVLAQRTTPMQKLNFACIGVGGKGSSDTEHVAAFGNIVGLCDVDQNSLKKKALRYKDAKVFRDYREMLDALGDKIDAITCSTPDHSHAPACVRALRMGKHVYCQKPLTWSAWEARRMRELAAEHGVCTQMGNQGTTLSKLREAVEIIKTGGLGEVRQVHVWTNRPIWPQGIGRPSQSMPVPPTLDWDLFLGPAPERPYANVYHPFKWRGWIDFGTGALGDMACHTANMPVMALELFDPQTVEAQFDEEDSPGFLEGETYPKWSIIKFQFGARGGLPPCELIWYDGGKKVPQELLHGEKRANSGCLVIGTKGSLYSPSDYGKEYVLLPKDKFKDYKPPKPFLPRAKEEGDRGHKREWIEAIQAGDPSIAMSNFSYAGRLTETILLGNLALHARKKIQWNPAECRVDNAPEVEKYLRRPYRKGFEVT